MAEGEDGMSMWDLAYEYNEHRVVISEDWSGDGNGLAGLQWLGGVALSRYFDTRSVFPAGCFEGKRVVELGAGCGLTSILLALLGADVTITDMDIEKCMPNVEQNLSEEVRSSRVHIEELLWGKEADLSRLRPPFDMIVAGDCIYEEACIVPLLETMQRLSDENTEVYMCGIVGQHCLKVFNRIAGEFCDIEGVDLTNVTEVKGRSHLGEGSEPTERQLMKLTFTNAKRLSRAESQSGNSSISDIVDTSSIQQHDEHQSEQESASA